MDMQAFDFVRQLAASHYLVRALHVAAELGVADQVKDRLALNELAAKIGADPDALQRILTLLASRGIFRVEGEQVSHTTASEFLRGDHPASLKSFVRMFGQRVQWQCAEDLQHAVRTGEAVATRHFPGGGLWRYFEENPADGRIFGEAMVAKSAAQIADILAVHDFSPYRSIADVGGGHGHMLRAILARHAAATGLLFDLPAVIDEARAGGDNDRLTFQSGDFFTTPLPRADAMLLMEVLHDWDDAHCAKILAAARRALGTEGRLLVIEIEMTEGSAPDWPKLLDIVMLTLFAARQRTNAEYSHLLQANGFRVERQTTTPGGVTIIEAMAR